jgi:selenocysteine lyase/cysteine desulfurase
MAGDRQQHQQELPGQGYGRRGFIKRVFTGIAGASLLVAGAKEELLARAGALADGLNNQSGSESYWELVKQSFSLQKGLTYFNNASLGPSPELVIDAMERFRRTLDGFPSKYMWGAWQEDKEKVRQKAAALMGASNEEIALIHNTTEGMNVVASSLALEPGDEVILADHEHPSGIIPWQYWQETKGIKLVRVTLPILPDSPDRIADLYRRAVTSKTKVISMCHMVNTNGMILPVKEVCTFARPLGIRVAVDGAQSAGMFTFSLKDLGCDFYAASSHKWIFSPKGMGIFYARKESQPLIKPLIVARGYEDRTIRRFENYNTRNLPELLGLGIAIDFLNLVGPKKIEERVYQLKRYFRRQAASRSYLNIKTPAPDSLSAGIVTAEVKGHKVNAVRKTLLEKYQIDCRPMNMFGLNGLRISLSIYITLKDIDMLMAALDEIAG